MFEITEVAITTKERFLSWYNLQSPEHAAVRFSEVEVALESVAKEPEEGPLVSDRNE